MLVCLYLTKKMLEGDRLGTLAGAVRNFSVYVCVCV